MNAREMLAGRRCAVALVGPSAGSDRGEGAVCAGHVHSQTAYKPSRHRDHRPGRRPDRPAHTQIPVAKP